MHGRLLLASLVVVIGCASACARGSGSTGDAATAASAPAATGSDDTPPLPVVRDDATNILYSFVDAYGRMQSVPRVDAVPQAARARVLVIDLQKSPEQRQAHRYAFFADLTASRPDGTYPVSVVHRYDATKQADGPAALPAGDGAVVVYSATWCGFCKKAKAWLKEHHVPYVERDVEKTPGAQAELSAKLKAAGVSGGGIPVIDWSGSVVMGFDVNALEKLLRDKPPHVDGGAASGASGSAGVDAGSVDGR